MVLWIPCSTNIVCKVLLITLRPYYTHPVLVMFVATRKLMFNGVFTLVHQGSLIATYMS